MQRTDQPSSSRPSILEESASPPRVNGSRRRRLIARGCAAAVVELGGRWIGMAHIAMDILQARTVAERGGDKGSAHGVGAVSPALTGGHGVLAKDEINAHRVQWPPQV